jgi:acyl carrier protein
MKDKIIQIISDIMETSINEDSNKNNSENWDSLNHVKLIVELQDIFEIKIPAEDIDKLLSVKDIIKYIEKKLIEKHD